MDFSTRGDLDELSATLRPIAERAEELGIDWLLIGAAGRDLILGYGHGVPAERATLDVDVAVRLRDWGEFRALVEALRRGDGACPHPAVSHRLVFPGREGKGVPVDLVPFGPIEERGEVRWASNADRTLNVRGLREAHRESVRVVLPGPLEVRVLSVESYVCLKLFAWRDRHRAKPRHDAVDLAAVLRHSDRLIDLNELYDRHLSAMRDCEYDPGRAVARIIGERLREALFPETRRILIDLLRNEVDESGPLALVREMGTESTWIPTLRSLLRGVRGRRGRAGAE